MEHSILEALQSLEYNGELCSYATLKEAVYEKNVPQSFRNLVVWLASHIKMDIDLKENVSGDPATFDLDVKGLVRELGCPYTEVIQSNRFETAESRLFLLDFLASELQACRMTKDHIKDQNQMEHSQENSSILTICVQTIFNVLKISMNTTQPFVAIETSLKKLLSTLPNDYIPPPLLKKSLSQNQWDLVSKINDGLCQEYRLRRELLIKRVDVTIQSFTWTEKMKKKVDEVSESFNSIRSALQPHSLTSIADVLAARTDLCTIERTSSGKARDSLKCAINKHMIGAVPDRGGRASSIPPPPDMPMFKPRTPDSAADHRGGHQEPVRGSFRGRGGSWRGRGASDSHRGSRGGYSGKEDKIYYS
ncbi:protein FAM98A isoform X1 [Hydra vulgaris]|uniref:Protein FAM98A n=1 Tax=Hydra vulgaris TaxID=6087 RepID=T2M981_HYDVU|nr:protein FAM98A isoform X2 [Hydra vulgaris]